MKDYSELINKIVEEKCVDKDDAWYFCNQLFQALCKKSIEDYLQRLKSAEALRSKTMANGETKSRNANAEYQSMQKNGIKV